MSYNIKNFAGTVTYTVNDSSANTNAVSLTLLGKSLPNYGTYFNQNFVWLTENFSSDSANPPPYAVQGQLWWDSTFKFLNVYDGTKWNTVYGNLATLNVNGAVNLSSTLTASALITSGGGQHIGYHTGAIGANGANTGSFTTVVTSGTANINSILYAATINAGTIGNTGAAHTGATLSITGNTSIATSGSAYAGIGTTAASTSNLIVYGTGTGLSNTSAGASIMQVQDGQGRAVANFLGGVDGTAKPTYAALNLGGAGVLSYSLATTHGISIGFGNAATISTTGAFSGPSVNAGTIGNSGASHIGATLTTTGNITAQTANMYAANHIANTATYSAAYYWANGVAFASSNYGNTQAAANLTLYTGTFGTLSGLTVGGAIVPSSNASINIGSASSQYFNNIYAGNFYGTNFYGTSTTAKYADLAEKYLPDAEYEVGTVMIVGGSAEITQHNGSSIRAIGVISEYPAYKMNSDLDGGVYVALKGRVPVKVLGPVKKGDSLAGTAHGIAYSQPETTATTFAIALENYTNTDIGLIEAVIL